MVWWQVVIAFSVGTYKSFLGEPLIAESWWELRTQVCALPKAATPRLYHVRTEKEVLRKYLAGIEFNINPTIVQN